MAVTSSQKYVFAKPTIQNGQWHKKTRGDGMDQWVATIFIALRIPLPLPFPLDFFSCLAVARIRD